MIETHPLVELMRANHEEAQRKGVACPWGCPVCKGIEEALSILRQALREETKEEEEKGHDSGQNAISILSLQDWLDSDYARAKETKEGKGQD